MKSKPGKVALRTALIYAVAGCAWILLSDRLLAAFVSDPDARVRLEIYKGSAFVVVTALLLYSMLRKQLRYPAQEAAERKQAEEALRNSERLLRLVMDLVPHFIFVKDEKSRHLLVNRACAEATPLTAEQMVGLSDLDMAPGSPQAEAFMKDDQEVITTGRPKFTEEKLIDTKGRTRILQTTKIPFPSSTITFPAVGNGKPAILGVSVDITERKRAEQQVAESRNYLDKIINSIGDPIFVKDRQHHWVLLNNAFCDFMGHKREELLGKSDVDFFPPNQAEVFWSKDEVVFTTGQENINEEEFTDAKGILHTIMTKKALYTDEKEEKFIVGIIRDMTERTQAERILQMFQFSIDQASDAIFWMTRDGGLTYVNEQACRSLGYTREELMRLHLPDFDPIFPKERWEAEWERFQKDKGGSQQVETFHRRKDGTVFPVSISSKHLWFGDTELHVAVARDVTERKQAESKLVEASALLEAMLENSPLYIYFKDLQSRFVRVSKSLAQSLQVSGPESLKGKTDSDFFPPSHTRAAREEEEQIIRTGQPLIDKLDSVVLSNGQRVWGLTTKLPWRDGEGNIVGTFGFTRDITAIKEAEGKLAHEQELFRMLLETTPDNLYFKDRESRFVRMSRSKVEGTLQTVRDSYRAAHPDAGSGEWPSHLASVESFAEWLKGKTDFDTYPEAHARAAYKDEQEIIRAGKPLVGKLEKATLPGGKNVWWLSTKMPWRDKDGNIIGTYGVSKDVTELKGAEEALDRERLLLRILIDLLPEVLYVKDLDSRFLVANETLAKHFGKDNPSQVLGLSDTDFFPPAMAAEFRAEEEKVLTGKSLIDHEQQVDFPDGRKCTLLTTKVPFRDSQEKIRGLVGIGRDITERKQAEEANARLATAVKQAAEAIVITDSKGTILYVNPAFEKVTGYATSEAIGQNPRILKSGKHDDTFYGQMWDVLSQGKVWSGRITNKKKNGSLYEEEMSISPVFDSAGKITNYVAVKRDVTQEVALETQLRQSQKMEIIGQLAGGVAHDFNNILTVIQGNASLLLLNPDTNVAEKMEFTQQIVNAAERAASLTRQLLMFGRKQVMQPAYMSLNEVVAQMTKMLRRVLGEHISLQSNYAANLPFIHGDIGMIEQILMNLVVNARDAMPAGGRLTITTGVKTVDKEEAAQNSGASPGLHVWLAVSDTGTGIAPEVLPRIFEPFFTTKEVGKGTGLGLATVYGIVQQHHGWITVTSEISKGTTFRIYFPAAAKVRPEKKTGFFTG
jgi:PAS domain S-box-containing protein